VHPLYVEASGGMQALMKHAAANKILFQRLQRTTMTERTYAAQQPSAKSDKTQVTRSSE
jgi:uncharacterized protein YigA (DUF484 family)